MEHGRAHLRFDVISDNRQIFVRETLRPNRVTGDENGNVIDKGQPSLERAASIKACRLLRADRQIINQHLRTRISQFGDDLFTGGFFFQRKECSQGILITHVRRIAVENAAHLYNRSREIDLLAENFRAIWRRENGPTDIEAYLPAINIKCRHHFDVARPIGANLPMHQPNTGTIGGGALIKVDSLNK